ncbi:hypothetical protein SJI45_13775 [Streptomyces sp. S399]|uniref:hypothetical protein n=1 Tax=Streptomyces sp. S399 TaxID=3096009 RepID=UPI002A82DF2C|nr:hypothetical protein [Streptomyces sp. S399]WPR51945.1 hypothetical protein SJI45_13775 [Streptomyces sp. S399]
MNTETEPLLSVRGLTKHFPVRQGLRAAGAVRAVDRVLTICRRDTVRFTFRESQDGYEVVAMQRETPGGAR